MKRTEIQKASPFKDLFGINDALLSRIILDMRLSGFDKNKPLIVWKNCPSVKPILVDGYTRMAAAEVLNIPDVPVVEKDFRDEREALSYAVACQRNRRNLADAEIFNCVAAVDKKRARGGDHGNQYTGGKVPIPSNAVFATSAEETAGIIGTEKGKVEKIRSLLASAPPDIVDAVKNGDITINAAYNKTMDLRRGNSETSKKPVDENRKINKIARSIRKRLSREQIVKLIRVLQERNDS